MYQVNLPQSVIKQLGLAVLEAIEDYYEENEDQNYDYDE